MDSSTTVNLPLIIAPLIAALAALAGILINIISSRVARREDREEKNHEWLRDKRVRDVEEIVTTLTIFARDFRGCIESLTAHQNSALRDVHTVAKAIEEERPVEEVFVGFLKNFYEGYEKDSVELWQLNTRTRNWFGGEAKRLSIWFDSADGVEEMLMEVGRKVQSLHISIHQSSAGFWHFVGRILDNEHVSYINTVEAQKSHRSLSVAVADWPEVDALILKCQKRLADMYKPTAMPTPPALVRDGLLVQLARWTEKNLRRLLCLR